MALGWTDSAGAAMTLINGENFDFSTTLGNAYFRVAYFYREWLCQFR